MKRTIALLLALILLAVSMPTASAAQAEGQEAATALYKLGLFRGTGTNADGSPKFELERELNRYEAVVMLVRLLGKEEEALQDSLHPPFRDMAAWAEPYIGCAFVEHLIQGVSLGVFGGNRTASAAEYLTMVLRALGYKSGTDFQWNKAWEKTDALGITDGRYKAGSAFTRGDAAIVSRNALSAKLKGSDKTLRASLEESGAIAAPENPPLTTEELVSFAIDEFQRVKREFPAAEAIAGHAEEFTNADGDHCVLTFLIYEPDGAEETETSEHRLYNLSKDTTIKNPYPYYDKLYKQASGAEKSYYLHLSSEINELTTKAIVAIVNVISYGQYTGSGVYVPPETLNA